MISLLHMTALVMPLQVGLPHKFLGAIFHWAEEWIFPSRVVGFHMSFEIVTPAKKLATAFDVALEVCIFFGGELPRLSYASECA
jgi:hypothetical protein